MWNPAAFDTHPARAGEYTGHHNLGCKTCEAKTEDGAANGSIYFWRYPKL